MPSTSTPTGQDRLMPVVIDELARDDPRRPWASVPYDDADLSRGYEDISYEVAANAINKLCWIIESVIGKSTTFETIAYLGKPDLRYHFMQMAACKTGHKVLFPAHLNSLHVHVGLLNRLECKALFYSTGMQVDDILAARPTTHVQFPELNEVLSLEERAEWYPYTKTYEEAAFDPYMVLHTSGTTGDPKPLVFNHAVISSTHRQRYLPDVEGRSHVTSLIAPGPGVRVLIPSSPFHVIASACPMNLSVLGGGVFVLPYRNRGISLDGLLDVFTHCNARTAVLIPYMMEAVAKKPNSQEYIKAFDKVLYGGGELSAFAQGVWAEHTRVQDIWGSSEIGFPPELESDPEDHGYVYFDLEHGGLEFQEVSVTDDVSSDANNKTKVYEMVLLWTPKSAFYSAYFARNGIRPDAESVEIEYRTGDIWTPHPDPRKSRYVWRFAGRLDDLVTLDTGVNVRPAPIEEALVAHQQVAAAIVLGNKRMQPLVLVELNAGTGTTNTEAAAVVDDIWKTVLEPLNVKLQSYTRITKTHVLVVPTDGLVRTPKGNISRPKSECKFSKEIEAVYQKFGDTWQDEGRP